MSRFLWIAANQNHSLDVCSYARQSITVLTVVNCMHVSAPKSGDVAMLLAFTRERQLQAMQVKPHPY